MLQQITIRTESKESIKPLVEVAIRQQVKSLQHGILRTRERLAAYEARFGMVSAEMERQLQSGELTETLDTIDWIMELAALRLLEEQHNSLREASID